MRLKVKIMALIKEEQLRKNFACNMRYLRLMQKPRMTQASLAKKLGVTRKSIHRYETAACLPPIHILMTMAEYFGYTVDELLDSRLPAKKGLKNNE